LPAQQHFCGEAFLIPHFASVFSGGPVGRAALAMLGISYAATAAVRVVAALSVSLSPDLGIGAAIGLALAAALLALVLNKIRKQRNLLDELFEQAPFAVALTDLEFRIIRVNREFTRVFGYAPEAAAGRLIGESIVPAESQAQYRKHADLLTQGQRVNAEGVRCRRDGSRFPATVTLLPVSSPGQGTMVCAIYRDMTEHQRAEEALRANQGRWRVLFENSAVGITVTDEHRNFIAANRAYREIVGYSEEELRATTYLDLTYEEDRPLNAVLAADVRAGRLPYFQLEKRYRRKDGQPVWVRVTASTSPEGEAGPRFGIAIVEDITERKQSEAKLREYEKVVQGLQEMIGVVGRDYRYVIANQTYLNYQGLTQEQVVGHLVSEVVGQDLFERVVKSKMDECFQGKIVKYELAVAYPNRGLRDLIATYFPIEGPAGVDRIAIVLQDITDRKRAEGELQRSFQELHALTARLESIREEERTTLARELHDRLGQALTAIRIDLAALRTIPGRKEQLQRIDAISGLVEETIHVVRRISTGLRPGILDDLGLAATVEWAAEEFQARTGIVCQVAAETNPAIDPERATALYRIFQEALTNIARHAGATQVTIGLVQNDSYLSLEVRDNGRGIAAEQLSASGSLGILGMRERAMLLGGEFTIAGDPLRGTTLRVRIPIADKAHAANQ
jgi:PAS domain S-box-containing protein